MDRQATPIVASRYRGGAFRKSENDLTGSASVTIRCQLDAQKVGIATYSGSCANPSFDSKSFSSWSCNCGFTNEREEHSRKDSAIQSMSGEAIWRKLSKQGFKDLVTGGASSFTIRPRGQYTGSTNAGRVAVIIR